MDKNIGGYTVGSINNATIKSGFTGWRDINKGSISKNPISSKENIKLEDVEIESVNISPYLGENIKHNPIDLSNLFIGGVSVKPGEIIDIKNAYGTLYKVYVPQNIDSNTKFTVFYPGTDGIDKDSKEVLEYLKSQPNQIVFMSYASGSASGTPMLKSISALMDELGIDMPINVFGFSRGAQFGEVFARNCINAGIEVNNLVLIDPANNCSTLEWQTNPSVTNILRDAGTKVTVFQGDGSGALNSYSLKNANKNGLSVNVIDVVNGHSGHLQINEELIKNGVLDFFAGNGELKNPNYYQVWNGDTWRPMTSNDAEKLK